MADFGTLTAGLRRWTKDHDPHVRAAVELLIWHETWIRRAGFVNAAVRRDGSRGTGKGTGVAWIDWDAARSFASTGPRASTSELAVLDLAVALGENRYRLSIMGDAHAGAIVTAFAQALGVNLAALAGQEVPGGEH